MELVYSAYKTKVHKDDDKACAIEVVEKDKTTKYYALTCNKYGFFNPWDIDHQRFKKRVFNDEEWKWVQILPRTFDLYCQFLETRNVRLKEMAERYEIFQ
jgi:hypothetical protein